MKEIRYSTKAKKDLKKYRNNPLKIQKLYDVLYLIASGVDLPENFRSHKLIGEYKGCMECHIEGDFLLIWIDEDSDFMEIIRLGSHSDLFS